MTRVFFLCFTQFLIAGIIHSQKISGIWKGVVFNKTDTTDIHIIHLDLNVIIGVIEGKIRIQPYQSNKVEIIEIGGRKTKNQLSTAPKKGKYNLTSFGNLHLEYHHEDGYLKGYPLSDSLRSVVLYKDTNLYSITEKNIPYLHWVKGLLYDLKHGLSSPQKRREELKNFKFENVYFDYDKYEIREEHIEYLETVVQMLYGHSDLRLKITGHTDSDGSNNYNDRLSQKRAESLIHFFHSKGIEKSRIVIDFRGEHEPVGNNKSKLGKQLNRRVNFTFI